MPTPRHPIRGDWTAKQAAKAENVSIRTIQRDFAQPRDQWLEDQRQRRLAILEEYEQNDTLTWAEVGRRYNIQADTARQLARRARKDREAEEAEKEAKKRAEREPTLPIEGLTA